MRRAVSVLATTLLGCASSEGQTADLWADRPLKIIQNSQANFPPALAAQGVTEGKVRAVLNIDADGRLADFLVTGYTHRELVSEVTNSIRLWEFEAAWQRGEPIGVRSEVIFSFEGRGMVLSLSASDALLASVNRMVSVPLTSLLCRPSELDEPLRAVHVVPPRHPGRLAPAPADRPTAVIDFYVDPQGRPRMPVAVRASHEIYAAAAIEALSQWRFNAPTRGGLPTLVRATQTFTFPKSS